MRRGRSSLYSITSSASATNFAGISKRKVMNSRRCIWSHKVRIG